MANGVEDPLECVWTSNLRLGESQVIDELKEIGGIGNVNMVVWLSRSSRARGRCFSK